MRKSPILILVGLRSTSVLKSIFNLSLFFSQARGLRISGYSALVSAVIEVNVPVGRRLQ